MSTDTLERTDLDTDISSAVEGAFEELDCSSVRGKELAPCGGKIAGYQEHHTCVQGWMCEVHWKMAMEIFYPAWKKQVEENGRISCVHCLNTFHDIRKYVRFTPV